MKMQVGKEYKTITKPDESKIKDNIENIVKFFTKSDFTYFELYKNMETGHYKSFFGIWNGNYRHFQTMIKSIENEKYGPRKNISACIINIDSPSNASEIKFEIDFLYDSPKITNIDYRNIPFDGVEPVGIVQ
jgi:hypothetical protein